MVIIEALPVFREIDVEDTILEPDKCDSPIPLTGKKSLSVMQTSDSSLMRFRFMEPTLLSDLKKKKIKIT